MTTTVPIALEMNMVTVEWSVTPVTIDDSYKITINQTFETNVPTPVLVVEPPNVNLPVLQPGQVFNGEFKVTNYGLIEVYDVKLEFPANIDDYDIEVMTSAIPDKIGAMQSITVPYRITRRMQTASLARSLCEEVQGYGGGNCVKNFYITVKGKCLICPNSLYERVVVKLANYLISTFYNCPTIIPSPTFVLPGGTFIYITQQPLTKESGGLSIPSSTSTPLIIENSCEGKKEGQCCSNDCGNPRVCKQGQCVPTNVQLCSAPVDVWYAKPFIEHAWLKTSSKELGMGPEGCGDLDGSPFGMPTEICRPSTWSKEQAKQQNTCKSVCVDEDCVNKELIEGNPLGPWEEPLNDCWSFAGSVIDKCTVK